MALAPIAVAPETMARVAMAPGAVEIQKKQQLFHIPEESRYESNHRADDEAHVG